MLNEAKVLIIEEDSGCGQELQAILRFINQTPVLVDSQNWESAFTEDTAYLAVLVDATGADQDAPASVALRDGSARARADGGRSRHA